MLCEPASSGAQAAPASSAATAATSAKRAPTAGDAITRARVHFDQGQAAYRAGRLKEALREFKLAYELAPSAELDFDLARIYERVGEPRAAIERFRAYLRQSELSEREREEIEARIERLAALSARQRAQLLQPPPSSAALTAEARTFFERGQKLFREARYAAALAAFAAARRFAPLPELAYNMALTSEKLGHAADAVDYYREYLRDAKDPTDVDAVQARIRALLTDQSPRPASP